jgi:hypothetical protein
LAREFLLGGEQKTGPKPPIEGLGSVRLCLAVYYQHAAAGWKLGDDTVIATDEKLQVTLNPVAEALTGWARTEAIAEVFRIINEDTRQTIDNSASKALRLGVVAGLANYTMVVAREVRSQCPRGVKIGQPGESQLLIARSIRKVPLSILLEHFVGARKQRLRDRHPQGLPAKRSSLNPTADSGYRLAIACSTSAMDCSMRRH